jgi:radical SAM superfamily enzyme YgiQ (UPF0313 family)
MVWKLCADLKKDLPKSFLAIGGPHATIFPEHIFEKTDAAVAVIGEGEDTFRELLNAIQHGTGLQNVSGLALKGADGKVFLTQPRKQIENIDQVPRPFYEGFENFKLSDYGGFLTLPQPTAPVISSRGCVYDCTYCASVKFWGNRWRYRSAENILDEIEWLVKVMGAKSVFFFDDNLPVNKPRLTQICEGIISRKLDIKWACCSHVKMVDEKLLKIMSESGCVSIDFGVESGSDTILVNINKKQTRADIERTFDIVHKSGIKPRAYLMVGNKGESEATIDETISLVAKIKPCFSIGATVLWLLPGTAVYDEAVKSGHITDRFWLEHDSVPYNLQEHSYKELVRLRMRLMRGIARNKGGVLPMISYHLKNIYYRFPFLSFLRELIPNKLR